MSVDTGVATEAKSAVPAVESGGAPAEKAKPSDPRAAETATILESPDLSTDQKLGGLANKTIPGDTLVDTVADSSGVGGVGEPGDATAQAEQAAREAQEAQQARVDAHAQITSEGPNGEPPIDLFEGITLEAVLEKGKAERGWVVDDPNQPELSQQTRDWAEGALAEAARQRAETAASQSATENEVTEDGVAENGEETPAAEIENTEDGEQTTNTEQQNGVTVEQQQIQELTQQLTDLKGENAGLKTELMGLKDQVQKMYEQMGNLVKAMETKDEKEKITLLGMIKAFLKGVVVGAVVEIKDAAVEEASAAGKPQQGGH